MIMKDILKKVKAKIDKNSGMGDFKTVHNMVDKLFDDINDISDKPNKIKDFLEKSEEAKKNEDLRDEIIGYLEDIHKSIDKAVSDVLKASDLMDAKVKKQEYKK